MNVPIKVGLIGFGMAGKTFHAPLLHAIPAFELEIIKTTKKDDIDFANKNYPEIKITDNIDEIFSNSELQLVVIATPNNSHFDIARQAIEAGKHVVIDKPFTVKSAEAIQLIELAKSKNILLSVYQNRRWDSDFLTLQKIIENKLVGNIVTLEARFDRFRNVVKQNAWKEEDLPGSGILYDLGSHLIDQATCLFGIPEQIFSDIRIQRAQGKAPDFFELILFYNSGLRVKLSAGMLVKSPAVKYLLTGVNGSYIKYGMDVQEEALKTNMVSLYATNWGEENENIWGTINTDINGIHIIGKIESEKGDYKKYYQNVANAIQGKEVLIVTAEQALITIQIIEKAILSNIEKRIIDF